MVGGRYKQVNKYFYIDSFIIVKADHIYFSCGRHVAGTEHIKLHSFYVTAYASQSDKIFMGLMSVNNMLHYYRLINSGWPVQIMADASYNFCSLDVACMGFSVNTLQLKLYPLAYALFSGTETFETYAETWKALVHGTICFMRKMVR